MSKFDFRVGDRVQLRDGRNTYIDMISECSSYSIYVACHYSSLNLKGLCYAGDEDPKDIIRNISQEEREANMTKQVSPKVEVIKSEKKLDNEERTFYINVYKTVATGVYSTEIDANKAAVSGCIGTLKITFNDEDFK